MHLYMSTMFGKNSPTMRNVTTMPENFHFDIVQDKLWSNTKLNEENGAVGILLATKALTQLISTPFVKMLSNSLGYRIPTVLGTFVLFLASLSTYYFFLLTVYFNPCSAVTQANCVSLYQQCVALLDSFFIVVT